MEGSEQLSVVIPMLKDVAANITAQQLDSGTPCANFDVAGVLEHMTALASAFAPMFQGQDPDPDPTDAPSPGGPVMDRFPTAMDRLLEAVQSPGALERTIQTPNGPLPGAVFARLVALDGLVHGWDLATSTRQEWQPPEDLVSEVDTFARQAITAQMRRAEAFAPEQRPAEGADAMSRLVAFTGRRVGGVSSG
jgi:uncharacterized protein (TIGR03086 family)